MQHLALLIAISLCATSPVSRPDPAEGLAVELVTSGKALDPKAGQAKKPERLPRPNTMNDLFERLKAAADETEGKAIAELIEQRWMRSGSDTADLLMTRAGAAVGHKNFALAVELLDRILVLEPRWAEAWSRRASVFYLLDDPVGAVADLHRALTLEPRHFNAWAGLGHIYLASEDKHKALGAYRRSLAIHPQQDTIRSRIEQLVLEVEGKRL
jgi:tetratricopeptide (TPR) repeat protein